MPNDDRMSGGRTDKAGNAEMVELVSEIVAGVVEKMNAEKKPPEQPVRLTNGHSKEEGIDLLELFYLMVSKLKYILIVAVIGAIAGGYYSSTLSYTMSSATAKLYLVNGSDSLVNLSDLQLGMSLAPDYIEVFNTWEVSQMVLEDLDLQMSYGQLQSMLTVSNPEKTRLLYITVHNPDPQLAADIANSFARSAREFILKTMETSEPNIFSIALVPSVITYVNRTRYVIIGFMLGAILVMGLVFLYFMLDNRPKSPDDIARYAGIPTLAVIPSMRKKRKFWIFSNNRAEKRY